MSMSDLQIPSPIITVHKNTLNVESNQYVEVVQFAQETRIDIKNMHLLKDINYWILVRDFHYFKRFHKERNKNMREFRVGMGSQL